MSTYGTSSPWTSPAEQREPASEAPEYGTNGDPADSADTDEGSADAALAGAAADDVVVVESVHTGDQGSAEVGATGADVDGPPVDGPPFRSTAASTAFASSDFGDLAAEPSDPAMADPAMADPAMADPAMADPAMADPAMADPAMAEHAAASATAPAARDRAAEWSEIKGLFVDDPSASVRRASDLVQGAVDGFMASLRQRQDALSSWQEGDATGTEDLRVALRGYRDLFGQLEQMSGQLPARGAGQSPGGPSPAGS